MGLLSWLFPSEEDKYNKAIELLELGQYAQALNLLDSLDRDDLDEPREKARLALKSRNLQVAIGCANAGEFEAAEEHLELAARFSTAKDPDVRSAKKEIAKLESKASVPQAPSGAGMGSDPLGMGGGATPMPVAGGPAGPVEAQGDDDLWSLPPDDPRVRFALLLESYPEDLRERLAALGPRFAEAVVAIDDGNPKGALKKLGSFVGSEPAARFERARAAQSVGNLPMAGSDLATFGDEVGHVIVGGMHTGALLGRILAEQGRLDDALAAVEKALETDQGNFQLRGTKASLLESVGQFGQADELARKLVREVPSDMGLYKLMARCRVQADKRIEAMQVLESGLKSNCTTGTCGSQPFDVDAGRLLARLYLEERLDPRRARELVTRVKASVEQPTWFEHYLDALTARNENDDDALNLARKLLPPANTPDEDPKTKMVLKAFPELSPSA